MKTAKNVDGDPLGAALLVGLLACCVVPMLAIVGLTAVAGLALGTSAVIAVGLAAAAVCIVVMTARHRSVDHGGNHRDEREDLVL